MKKFAGFTPQQQYTLLSKQGYTGPADEASMAKFLAASPSAASKMGEYAQIAQQRLAGQPMPTQNMFAGGAVAAAGVAALKGSSRFGDKVIPQPKPYHDLEPMPRRPYEGYVRPRPIVDPYPDGKPLASNVNELAQKSVVSPTSIVTQPEVAKIEETPGTILPSGTGQAPTRAGATTTAAGVTQAQAPKTATTSLMTPTTIGADTPQATAAKGEVSDQALVTGQTLDAGDLSQLTIEAPQVTDPTQVIPPPPRQIEAGEIVSGSAVDMAKVNEAVDIQAAQANPSKAATVQGQLESLMTQFEGGETPAWAAGAMRQATAALASRGLGASSMAGQAVVQAAMESALPIAMADAQTRASFEAQNLSNRQQTALFGAEQRAKFLGMEFDQNFQTRVMNAAKVSDIANMNFTSEVQIALENSRLTQTADLANLDVSKAKMLSDMAAMTQVDLTNLNNRQQAAVQNAQAFLQTDLTNLNNEQQTTVFNTQSKINSLLSDQAAQNAAKQFNAASQNQTDQFFAELSTTVSRFNAEQKNAISQFNAGEINAVSKFNAQVQAQRDQFNANNSLVVAQANAQWRQNLTTLNTAAQNEANMLSAKVASGFTQSTIDNIWQRERDIMNAALTTAEGDANRAVSLMIADKDFDAIKFVQSAKDQAAKSQLIFESISNFFKWG